MKSKMCIEKLGKFLKIANNNKDFASAFRENPIYGYTDTSIEFHSHLYFNTYNVI